MTDPSPTRRHRYVLAATLVVVAFAGIFTPPFHADTNSSRPPGTPRIGPSQGHLILVGGGRQNPVIDRRFMELAGGPDAPLVVIPTAMGGDLDGTLDTFAAPFRRAGFTDVTVLHTHDPETADSPAFVAPLLRARAVWFGGGRQWRLVDAYAGTRTETEINAVLARGGVIGGTSAGATIQGSYLVRGAPEGNTIMMSPGHEVGFGYLRDVAIDQHVLAAGRQRDLIPVIEAHPELLGLGIDESTALVVSGDRAEVIGSSQVLVYDHAHFGAGNDEPWFVLNPGDVLDLAARQRLDPH